MIAVVQRPRHHPSIMIIEYTLQNICIFFCQVPHFLFVFRIKTKLASTIIEGCCEQFWPSITTFSRERLVYIACSVVRIVVLGTGVVVRMVVVMKMECAGRG